MTSSYGRTCQLITSPDGSHTLAIDKDKYNDNFGYNLVNNETTHGDAICHTEIDQSNDVSTNASVE